VPFTVVPKTFLQHKLRLKLNIDNLASAFQYAQLPVTVCLLPAVEGDSVHNLLSGVVLIWHFNTQRPRLAFS
jgi:hypothetical protein